MSIHQQKILKSNNKNSKSSNVFSKKTVVNIFLYIIVSATLCVTTLNFTKVPQVKFVDDEPTTLMTEEIPQPTLIVNKQDGAFQTGIEEGQYEESMVTVVYEPVETCFIGGIRFETMKDAVLTDVKFITTENDDLNWLEQNASKELENIQNSVKLCLVSVGLSHLTQSTEYASILNNWIKQFPNISFVFVALGPIDETLYKECTNLEIRNFNSEMKDKLNDNWRFIDLFQYLAEIGIESTDGITYSNSLNGNLLTWMLSESEQEQVLEYVPVQSEWKRR